MATDKKLNRRKFLGTSAAGAVGLGLTTGIAKGADASAIPNPPGKDLPFNNRTFAAMPTNAFGKTGYKVGILSLGGQATIETAGKEDESEKIISDAGAREGVD